MITTFSPKMEDFNSQLSKCTLIQHLVNLSYFEQNILNLWFFLDILMFHYTIEDKFMMIVSMGVIAVTCPISIHNHYLIVCISNCKK